MRHFLHLLDVQPDELRALLHRAGELKAAHEARQLLTPLTGRTIALIFEKPSLRTRVSFEAGIAQLGGTSLFFPGSEVGLGWRETLGDFARTLSGYVDAMIMRVTRHTTLDEVCQYASVPVINGLSNLFHPCQALADVFTIHEVFGDTEGRTVAFIGDGNNVARSLAIACGKLNMQFILASPNDYTFDQEFLTQFRQSVSPNLPTVLHDPIEAVRQADIIYTDVWASMGQEDEKAERLNRFQPFQVNEELLSKAVHHARVMHCLPANRGEEITDAVLDGSQSVAFQQAENRMHAQKALLEWLLK